MSTGVESVSKWSFGIVSVLFTLHEFVWRPADAVRYVRKTGQPFFSWQQGHCWRSPPIWPLLEGAISVQALKAGEVKKRTRLMQFLLKEHRKKKKLDELKRYQNEGNKNTSSLKYINNFTNCHRGLESAFLNRTEKAENDFGYFLSCFHDCLSVIRIVKHGLVGECCSFNQRHSSIRSQRQLKKERGRVHLGKENPPT